MTLAQEMIDGKISFLEGALELSSLRHEAEVDERDEDLMAFVVIESETDSLPMGKSKKYWSAEALDKHQTEIDKATEWAKEFGIPACKSLIRRFHA